MAGMFQNDSAAGPIRVTEEDIRVPDTRTLNRQFVVVIRRMVDRELTIELKGSARNIECLLLIRCTP